MVRTIPVTQPQPNHTSLNDYSNASSGSVGTSDNEMMVTTPPDEGNHMGKHDKDCLNALSLSILSHDDLSAAAMKMIPSCRHHELVLIAAYLLRGDQHLDERKKLAQLITSNPTNEKENESTVARDESEDENGIQENSAAAHEAEDTHENHGEEEGIVVQKLLAQNNTQQSSQVEPTPETKSDPFLGTRWGSKYQELLEYRAEHGHCRIPQTHKALGAWVKTIRQLRKENKIPEHRLERLQAVGFFEGVSASDQMWDKIFAELIEFKANHGHCEVPDPYPDNQQLGKWAIRQRVNHAHNMLSMNQVNRLEALGFRLRTDHGEMWENRFAELVEFKANHGHCLVPRLYSNSRQLNNWVDHQRRMYAKKKLSSDRVQRLEALGFQWSTQHVDRKSNEAIERTQSSDTNRNAGMINSNLNDKRWERRFAELIEFKSNHGHCLVPKLYSNNPRLGNWVAVQRRLYAKKKLTSDRVQRLETLGFQWSTQHVDRKSHEAIEINSICNDERWEKRFAELVEFKVKNGHCRVPWDYGPNPVLGRWVKWQRYNRSLLDRGESTAFDQNRIRRLNAIGFQWRLKHVAKKSKKKVQQTQSSDSNRNNGKNDEKWEKRFAELVQFKVNNGHCRVPRPYPNNPQLCRWTMWQRAMHKKHMLSLDRALRLEALGFWSSTGAAKTSNESKQQARSNGKKSNAHDDISMPFVNEELEFKTPMKNEGSKTCNQSWDVMYEQLIDYHDIHGNVDVPENYEENFDLSVWVDEVRRCYQRSELREDQIRGLNEIGFSWNVTTSPKTNVIKPATTTSADVENDIKNVKHPSTVTSANVETVSQKNEAGQAK